jgi:hypothetical protein
MIIENKSYSKFYHLKNIKKMDALMLSLLFFVPAIFLLPMEIKASALLPLTISLFLSGFMIAMIEDWKPFIFMSVLLLSSVIDNNSDFDSKNMDKTWTHYKELKEIMTEGKIMDSFNKNDGTYKLVEIKAPYTNHDVSRMLSRLQKIDDIKIQKEKDLAEQVEKDKKLKAQISSIGEN